MRKAIILISVVCLSWPAFAREAVDRGVERFLKGDLKGAVSEWRQEMDARPGDKNIRFMVADCLTLLGKQAMDEGNVRQGYQYIRDAWQLMPDGPEKQDLQFLYISAEMEYRYQTGKETSFTEAELDGAVEKNELFDLIFLEKEEPRPNRRPPPPPPPKPEPPKEEQAPGEFITHIAVDGETLASIAVKYYNDWSKWKMIWENNPQLKNPHRLFPGMAVKVPLKP